MNVEQGVWRRCMGYCVLVRDGKVYKYYNESQADPEIISVRKPSTLSAFKSKMWRKRRAEEKQSGRE